MAITDVRVSRIMTFQPVRLWVSDVGLFSEPFSLDLIDANKEPANIFLLASPNGLGKTTLLVTFSSIFESFAGFEGRFRQEDLNSGRGFAQLDAIAHLEINDSRVVVGLSFCCGRNAEPQGWQDIGLSQDILDGIEDYATVHFVHGTQNASTDDIGHAFLEYIETGLGQRPGRLYDDDHTLPTVLSFPATRRVVRPPEHEAAIVRPPDFGYQPLQVFENDGDEWATSLTNLLLWAYWMNDGRYEELQDMVEESVLTDKRRPKALGDVSRANLMPLVTNEIGVTHRLDRISHGERSKFQILARIAMHTTGLTFVVIDELELHQHPNWSIGLLETLKNLVKGRPISVIFTTHSPEIIAAYEHDKVEQGLRKGGHIIEHEELSVG